MSTQRTPARKLGPELRREIAALLDGGHAHATFDDAVKNFPVKLRGTVPENLPYSAWQIVEHIRIAQHDMLTFSDNFDGAYQPRKWPDSYWPAQPEPPNARAWQKSLDQIRADRAAFDKLLAAATDAQLIKPFPWGTGQSLLKEALQIADHNAYHIGELVILRRVLGAWKK